MKTRISQRGNKVPVLELQSQCGIYALKAVHSNSYYVGQSYSLFHRIDCHYKDLLKGEHKNADLQESFNKLGDDGIDVEILEYIDANEISRGQLLAEAESKWTWKLAESNKVQGSRVQNMYECSPRASTSRKVGYKNSHDIEFVKQQIALWTKRLTELT